MALPPVPCRLVLSQQVARQLVDEHASAVAARDVASVELAQLRASAGVLHGDLLDILAAVGPVLLGDPNPPEWQSAVETFKRVLATHRPDGETR